MNDLSEIKERILKLDSVLSIISEKNNQLEITKENCSRVLLKYKEECTKTEKLQKEAQTYQQLYNNEAAQYKQFQAQHQFCKNGEINERKLLDENSDLLKKNARLHLEVLTFENSLKESKDQVQDAIDQYELIKDEKLKLGKSRKRLLLKCNKMTALSKKTKNASRDACSQCNLNEEKLLSNVNEERIPTFTGNNPEVSLEQSGSEKSLRVSITEENLELPKSEEPIGISLLDLQLPQTENSILNSGLLKSENILNLNSELLDSDFLGSTDKNIGAQSDELCTDKLEIDSINNTEIWRMLDEGKFCPQILEPIQDDEMNFTNAEELINPTIPVKSFVDVCVQTVRTTVTCGTQIYIQNTHRKTQTVYNQSSEETQTDFSRNHSSSQTVCNLSTQETQTDLQNGNVGPQTLSQPNNSTPITKNNINTQTDIQYKQSEIVNLHMDIQASKKSFTMRDVNLQTDIELSKNSFTAMCDVNLQTDSPPSKNSNKMQSTVTGPVKLSNSHTQTLNKSTRRTKITLRKAVEVLKRSKIDITLKGGRLIKYNKQSTIRTNEDIQRRMERNIMSKLISYINKNLESRSLPHTLGIDHSSLESSTCQSDADSSYTVSTVQKLQTILKGEFDSGYTSGHLSETIGFGDSSNTVLEDSTGDVEIKIKARNIPSGCLSRKANSANCDDNKKVIIANRSLSKTGLLQSGEETNISRTSLCQNTEFCSDMNTLSNQSRTTLLQTHLGKNINLEFNQSKTSVPCSEPITVINSVSSQSRTNIAQNINDIELSKDINSLSNLSTTNLVQWTDLGIQKLAHPELSAVIHSESNQSKTHLSQNTRITEMNKHINSVDNLLPTELCNDIHLATDMSKTSLLHTELSSATNSVYNQMTINDNQCEESSDDNLNQMLKDMKGVPHILSPFSDSKKPALDQSSNEMINQLITRKRKYTKVYQLHQNRKQSNKVCLVCGSVLKGQHCSNCSKIVTPICVDSTSVLEGQCYSKCNIDEEKKTSKTCVICGNTLINQCCSQCSPNKDSELSTKIIMNTVPTNVNMVVQDSQFAISKNIPGKSDNLITIIKEDEIMHTDEKETHFVLNDEPEYLLSIRNEKRESKTVTQNDIALCNEISTVCDIMELTPTLADNVISISDEDFIMETAEVGSQILPNDEASDNVVHTGNRDIMKISKTSSPILKQSKQDVCKNMESAPSTSDDLVNIKNDEVRPIIDNMEIQTTYVPSCSSTEKPVCFSNDSIKKMQTQKETMCFSNDSMKHMEKETFREKFTKDNVYSSNDTVKQVDVKKQRTKQDTICSLSDSMKHMTTKKQTKDTTFSLNDTIKDMCRMPYLSKGTIQPMHGIVTKETASSSNDLVKVVDKMCYNMEIQTTYAPSGSSTEKPVCFSNDSIKKMQTQQETMCFSNDSVKHMEKETFGEKFTKDNVYCSNDTVKQVDIKKQIKQDTICSLSDSMKHMKPKKRTKDTTFSLNDTIKDMCRMAYLSKGTIQPTQGTDTKETASSSNDLEKIVDKMCYNMEIQTTYAPSCSSTEKPVCFSNDSMKKMQTQKETMCFSNDSVKHMEKETFGEKFTKNNVYSSNDTVKQVDIKKQRTKQDTICSLSDSMKHMKPKKQTKDTTFSLNDTIKDMCRMAYLSKGTIQPTQGTDTKETASSSNDLVKNMGSKLMERLIEETTCSSNSTIKEIDSAQSLTKLIKDQVPSTSKSIEEIPMMPTKEMKKNVVILWGSIREAFKNVVRFKGEEVHANTVMSLLKTLDTEKVTSYLLYEVVEDGCEIEKGLSSFEPFLSITQKTVIGLLLLLEKTHWPDIVEVFLSLCEQRLLFKEKDPTALEQVVRVYAAICKMRKLDLRMRGIICDGLYFMGDLVVPLIYYSLTSWVQVLKRNHLENALDGDPVAKVLVHVVQTKTCTSPEYCLCVLKNLLHIYYKYPNERYNENQLIKEFLERYMCGLSEKYEGAILILCKNSKCAWVKKQVDLLEELVLILKDKKVIAALVKLKEKILKQIEATKT